MDHLFRQQSGKMNSILINSYGFEYSEIIDDVIQETFLIALKQWGMKGVPDNPEGWLMQVSKNKFLNEINRLKRHGKLNIKSIEHSELDGFPETLSDNRFKQEQLRTLFSCCTPQISAKAQIMLTLKIVSGFGDREIAKALLMNEQAVRKAIYRARNTIKEIGESALVVSQSDYKDRQEIVLKILYLMFNEGYHSSSGDKLLDEDITFEAIRLTSWLLEIKYLNHSTIHAVLALMFFNFSRFDARLNKNGEIMDIEQQDRSTWSKELIQKGMYHQKKSRETEVLTSYHIESGIAAVHCLSQSYDDTNWAQIANYYERLMTFDSSLQVQINFAIALSENGESLQALNILKGIDQKGSENKSLLFGAMARVHRNLKQIELATSYYKVALDMTENDNERKFYEAKIANLLLNTDRLNN